MGRLFRRAQRACARAAIAAGTLMLNKNGLDAARYRSRPGGYG
jgi:hypothetical protein